MRLSVVNAVTEGGACLEGGCVAGAPRKHEYLRRLTVGCLQFVFFHS